MNIHACTNTSIDSPIIVIAYDVSIVNVYDVSLLMSMKSQFQSRLGKKLTEYG